MKKFYFIPIVVIVLILIYIFVPNLIFDFSKFSTDKWDRFKYKRYLMVDDLEKQYNFDNMSREQIKKILGNRGVLDNSQELTYIIGIADYGFGFKKYYVFYFDESNKCDYHSVYIDISNSYVNERSIK